MVYLLDANALISAHNGWFALNRVPEFWLWLLHHAEAGILRCPPKPMRRSKAATTIWPRG